MMEYCQIIDFITKNSDIKETFLHDSKYVKVPHFKSDILEKMKESDYLLNVFHNA